MNNRSHSIRALLILVSLSFLPGLASAAQVYGRFTLVSGTYFGIGVSSQSTPVGPLQDELPPVGSPAILPPLYAKYVVDYGAISVYAYSDGTAPRYTPPFGTPSSSASATAGFQDSFTITAPGAPFYSQGSMDIRIDVTGQLLASGSSEANYGVDMYVGSGGCCSQLYGTRYGEDVPGVGGGFYGFSPGSYVFNAPITFGALDTINIEGYAGVWDREGSGSAVADLYSTIGWGGVLAVYDADGMPLQNFQMISDSGYDYATLRPAIVPLPATVWMLLTGIGVLVVRRFS